MKKFFLGLALLGMTSLSLTACIGGKGESAPADETSATEDEVVEPEVVDEATEGEEAADTKADETAEGEVEVDAEATVK